MLKEQSMIRSEKYLNEGWVELPANFNLYSKKQQETWLKELYKQIIGMKGNPALASEFMGITINHEQAINLGADFAKLVAEHIPQCPIAIDISDDGLFTTEEFNKVLEMRNALVQNNSLVCFKEFSKLYSFEKGWQANNKISRWADEINKMKIGDRALSPLEKFYMAYNIVASFEYKASEDLLESRNIISVLTGEHIVCCGFASMLSELCRQIGIECLIQKVKYNGSDTINHQCCRVKIKDEIYDVDGIFYSDPTFGSRKGVVNFSYALLPFEDLPKLFGNRINLDVPNVHIVPAQFGLEEHFKDVKTTKQWQAEFHKYTKKTLPRFLQFIDEAVALAQDGPHHFRPSKQDYNTIIDRYASEYIAAENMLYNDIEGESKQDFLKHLKKEFGGFILTYTSKQDLETFKKNISNYYLSFEPEVETFAFEGLQKACYEEYVKSAESNVEKAKKNNKPLTYSKAIDLLMNIAALQGIPQEKREQAVQNLLVESATVALSDWNNPNTGINPISYFIDKLELHKLITNENSEQKPQSPNDPAAPEGPQ